MGTVLLPFTPILIFVVAAAGFSVAQGAACSASDRIEITGELRQWHKVTLTLDGPEASERDEDPNPFLDYRLTVTFTHASGSPSYAVPGYFAADGAAAESSAESGNKWRAHLAPDKPGEWTYRVAFFRGKHVAVDPGAHAEPVEALHGASGRFTVAPTNKSGRDFRARGRLEYAGGHHLRFAGTGEYFLKAGPDAPETLLAYVDFDGTETRKAPLKTWQPHVRDWRPGDPAWKDGRGKGLIGALNYLAGRGLNAFSFLPYNAGGDGDNVWPFVSRDGKRHYDCSKLDQWQIVFDHAQALGLYLHFKLQETEMDDGSSHGQPGPVPTGLDGGDLGVERRLYCRELIARFGYELALNWNLGEENSQSPEQQRAMAQYIRETDPYRHHIVVHTFPNEQDKVYNPLLGDQSVLTGVSLQNGWDVAHQRTLHWVIESSKSGRPWVVAFDEQNPASLGVPPDPGYAGHSGRAGAGDKAYDLHDIRKNALWGTLLAGGAGVEYYFGYELPQNDLELEDFRSRERSWEYCRIALDFFRAHDIPFWEMANADALVGNPNHGNSRYCFAKSGELYLLYLCPGGTAQLDLSEAVGEFRVQWFNPREGGGLSTGSAERITGGGKVSIGNPPRDAGNDWLVVIRRE